MRIYRPDLTRIPFDTKVLVLEGERPNQVWSSEPATVSQPYLGLGESFPDDGWYYVEFRDGVRLMLHGDRLKVVP